MCDMEAHTPKRYAVERFIEAHKQQAKEWQVRVVDEHDDPVVRLEATKRTSTEKESRKLEVHTRQVSLAHDDIDDSTKKMISRWLDSLNAPGREAQVG